MLHAVRMNLLDSSALERIKRSLKFSFETMSSIERLSLDRQRSQHSSCSSCLYQKGHWELASKVIQREASLSNLRIGQVQNAMHASSIM
jgi:hypothetical protein